MIICTIYGPDEVHGRQLSFVAVPRKGEHISAPDLISKTLQVSEVVYVANSTTVYLYVEVFQ